MIEEAAGTRMFETKKLAAYKTMSKKDKKVQEIQELLENEITPNLEKLRHDRSSYLEYQKTKVRSERRPPSRDLRLFAQPDHADPPLKQTEIDHLSRFVVAWDYMQAEETRVSSAAALEDLKSLKTKLEADLAQNKTNLANDAQNMELVKKRRAAVR